MSDSQRYSLNLYLINNVEEFVVFLWSSKSLKNQFSIINIDIFLIIHTWSDKAFKGAVVNRALESSPGGSLKIFTIIDITRLPDTSNMRALGHIIK